MNPYDSLHPHERRYADTEAALAAERENRDKTQPDSNTPDEITQLRQQLADEREKVKTLVEALEALRVKVRTHNVTISHRVKGATEIIDAALAKMKE